MRAAIVVQQLCKSCRTCFKFYCMLYFTCDRSLRVMSNSIISYRVDIVLRTTQVDSCSSRSLGRRRRHAHHTRNAPSSSNRSAVHHTPARSEHLYDRDHTGIYRWLRRTLSRRRSHTLRCSSPRNVLHRILRLVNHACKVSWARFRNADYTYKIKKNCFVTFYGIARTNQ